MKDRIYPVIAVVAALMLAACAGRGEEEDDPESASDATPETGEESDEPPEDEISVTIGTSTLPSAAGLVSAVIDEEGLAEQHGLDVSWSDFAPDQAELAVLTGQVDAGFFPIIQLANVRAEGEDVVFIRPLQANHTAVVVREDSPYERLEDLRGETIAMLDPVSGVYTSMQVVTDLVYGLSLEDDFDVRSAPPPGQIAFLEGGDVEAIVIHEPHPSILESSGDYRIVNTPNETWEDEIGMPMFMIGISARESWISDNEEAARRIDSMYGEALSLISENPEIMRDFQDEMELSDEAMDLAIDRMGEIFIADSGAEISESVDTVLEVSLDLGIIEEMPDRVFADLGEQ